MLFRSLQSLSPVIRLIQSELNNTAKERIVKLKIDAASVENELKRIQQEKNNLSKEELIKLKLDGNQALVELKNIQQEKNNLNKEELIKIRIDAKQAQSELDNLHSHAQTVSSNIDSIFQGIFQGIGIGITNSIGNSFKGVEGVIGDSINKFSTFQEKINTFATFNGSATTSDVSALAEETKRLGKVTSTTATEAAEAAVQLTKVGLNAKETKDQLEGVVQLSEASGLKDMGLAAQVAGTAFSTLGMQSKDTADLISTVVANIGGNAQDFLQLFSKAGGEAKATGQSIEGLATMFGILRKNGFEAETAGTALKTSLQRLSAPSSAGKSALKELGIDIFNSQGKMKQMVDLLPEFKTKLAGFNDASKMDLVKHIFGSTGAPAFFSLMSQATEKVDELYNKSVNRKGNASVASAKQLEGLPGAQKLLKGSVEGLQLNLADAISPVLEGMTRLAVGVVNKLLDNKDMFSSLSQGAKSFSDYLKNTPQIAEVLVQTFTQLTKLFSEGLGRAAKQFTEYLKSNPEALQNLATGAVQLATSLGQAAIAAFDFGKGFTEASIQIGQIFQPIANLALSLIGASEGSVNLAENFGKIAAYALVISGIGSVLGTIVAVSTTIAAIAETIGTAIVGVTAWVASVGGLAAIWGSVVTVVELFIAAIAPIALTIAGIVAACVLVYETIIHWSEITKVVGDLWNRLIATMNGIVKSVSDALSKSEIFKELWNAIIEVVKLLFSPFTTVIGYVGDLIQKSDIFKGIWTELTGVVSGVGNTIKTFCGGALDFVINKAKEFYQTLKSIVGMGNNSSSDGGEAGSTVSVTAMRRAILGQESGSNSTIVNKDSGALGYGQVMPANVPSWTKEALGKSLSPDEFLHDASAQIKTIDFQLGKMFSSALKTTSSYDEAVRKVAAEWYSGQQNLFNDTKSQNGYPSIKDYTQQVLGRYKEEISKMPKSEMSNPSGSGGSNGGSDAGSKVAQEALSRSGGEFRAGVSAQCANFVRDVLEKAGVKVGTTMAALDGQSTGAALASSFFGKDIGQIIKDKSKIKPGDLLAFGGTYGGYDKDTITHVGISTGNNQMVDRSTSSAPVKNRSIDTFEGQNSGFLYAVRPNAYGSSSSADAETRAEAEKRVGISDSGTGKRNSKLGSSTEVMTDDGDTTELKDSSAESEADKAAKKAQAALDIARKGQDKQIAEDRKLAKIRRDEQKEEQKLEVDQLLASTNNPEVKAALENRKKELSIDNTHDDKIIDYSHQKDDLILARNRKVQDLKSGDEKKVEEAKSAPDYSAAIKNLDIAIGLEQKLLVSTRGVHQAEKDNADSQKTQTQKRLEDAGKLQNAYETQRSALEEQKLVAEHTNPVLAKALDIQIQRLDLQHSTNKALTVEVDKLKDLTVERDKYAKILKDSGAKPDATLNNLNTEIKVLSSNIDAIKAKSGSNLKIIADKEVQNAKELAQQLAKINQEKYNRITDTQNNFAKAYSGQLRENGNTKAADSIDKQIALSEQEKANKEAILSLDEEIANKAKTNNAYSANEITQMSAQIKALNQINVDGINNKFDSMRQSLKSIGQSLQSSLGSAFKSILDGSQTAGQAFKSFIGSMLSNLASLAANSLLKDLFGGGGSGGGGIFGSLLGGLFGGNKGGGSSGGGVSGILGGGGGLGSIVGSLFHLTEGGYRGTIPNYANGNPISQAMNRERSQSGKNPMLAVINEGELVLSASQTEKFMKMNLGKMLGSNIRNFASGNSSDFSNVASSSSSANSTTVNVPITINGGSDGSKPQLDVGKLRDSVRNIVISELQSQRRNAGLLSD